MPPTLGRKNGKPMLLVYQTDGQTSTGPLPPDPRQRWRLFFVNKFDQVAAAEATIWGTANNQRCQAEWTLPSGESIASSKLRPLPLE